MGRRMTKSESEGCATLLVFGFIVWVVVKGVSFLGSGLTITLVIGSIIAWISLHVLAAKEQKEKEAQRRRDLLIKYGDETIVNMIIQGQIWEGQTSEQLLDARGYPLAKDEKFLKTKKKEVWKYDQTGTNRFATRVTLDDDVVVGWDIKGQ